MIVPQQTTNVMDGPLIVSQIPKKFVGSLAEFNLLKTFILNPLTVRPVMTTNDSQIQIHESLRKKGYIELNKTGINFNFYKLRLK